MSRLFKAVIKENIRLNPRTFLLTLQPVEPIQKPEPGQFFMVSIEHGLDPLLKRAFSLYRWFGQAPHQSGAGQEFQILYRVVGKATEILKGKTPGNLLDVLGPLGNSYPMPTKNQTPLIVAGGIGIASLFFLAERLAKSAYILYGARTEHELFFMNELKEYARDLLISTDDGSNGERGTVVEVLSNFLTRHSSLVTRHLIYACGSRQMLEAISKITADKGVTAYISMEENMACGIGACLGCAVRTKDGYKRVCKEGPVFPIEEIVW